MSNQSHQLAPTNPHSVKLGDMDSLLAQAESTMELGREMTFHPNSDKEVPHYGYSEIGEILGIEAEKVRKKVAYASQRQAGIPNGFFREADGKLTPVDPDTPENRRRKTLFPPSDLRPIVELLAPHWMRPAGVPGFVLGVCNFKGGVAKSTTTLTMAQAMSLRGMKVLIIDLDPQGTSTKWMTVKYIQPEDTCLELFHSGHGDLKSKILPTYWPGIDLIAADESLQAAEYFFTKALKEKGDEAMKVVPAAIRDLTADYDVIVIDTPPSLNNLTLAALFATDGLVMPLPPSNPDLESSVKFWRMYRDACRLMGVQDNEEIFQFIRVLVSKAENNKSTQNMMDWIERAYSGYVSTTVIQKSAAVAMAADSFGTVYDVPKGSASKNKSAREAARQLYDSAASEIANLIYAYWRREQEKLSTN